MDGNAHIIIINIELADEVSELSQRAAYDKYLPDALGIPQNEVSPIRFDVNLAFDNVQIGLRSLEEKRAVLLAMPGMEPDILEKLRGYSLALLFAARKVDQTVDKKEGAGVDLRELSFLRAIMLDGYRNAARKGLVPKEPFDAIYKGRGIEDASADCIDLAALYRQHWSILRDKTPVTMAEVERAEQVAQRVRDLIALEGGVFGKSSDDVKKAADIRNRFGILLVRAHDRVLAAAPYLFGKNWKDFVPTRQSRRAVAYRQRKAETKAKKEAKGNESAET